MEPTVSNSVLTCVRHPLYYFPYGQDIFHVSHGAGDLNSKNH